IYSSSKSPLTIADSTFVGNFASNAGGVLYVAGYASYPVSTNDPFNIVNSTFTGNLAHLAGGAIFTDGAYFQGTISSSTIAGNQVDSGGRGGGIFFGAGVGSWPGSPSGTGNLVLYNTIVAGNAPGSGAGDIQGNLSFPTLSAYNLIGDSSLTNVVNGQYGNIV